MAGARETAESSVGKADVIMVDHADQAGDHPEKAPQVRVVDDFHVLGLTQDDADFYNNYTPEQRKRTRRKVDIRLIPMLASLYLISHLDRSNIGNTKIEGIDKDLGITGIQWNIVLSLFFVPYIIFEVPSNVLLKKFMRPSIYLGILVTSWGVIMTLHGVVRNFGGLLAVRLILGVFEAGFFPGAVYLCTFWYMPKDLASRISWFYCMSAMSGAFSGLLAAAIAQMDGFGGYEGWRWIFIIEGIVTVVLGIATFFLLIDTPELGHKWLEPDEIRYLQLQGFIKQGGRFKEDGAENRHIWKELWACLTNWRLWVIAYVQFAQSAMSYGTKFNLPTITRAMGFKSTQAQLLSAPPYVMGAISAIIFSRISDRFYWRMPFVVIPFTMVTIGFGIMLGLQGSFEENIGAAYTAVIIACMGIYPAMPAASAWAANNLAPSSRRAVGLALNIAIGNCGGIMGSYMFFDSDAPRYNTGFGLSIAWAISGIIAALVAEAAYKWGNSKKGRMDEDEIRARYTEDELLRMGDRSPLFRYTL
ncbi:MFS transporter ACS family allantoate permease [Microdochium nivale]|nr:MFS transporter ACS family allantoate permease [Microdochium nivale]